MLAPRAPSLSAEARVAWQICCVQAARGYRKKGVGKPRQFCAGFRWQFVGDVGSFQPQHSHHTPSATPSAHSGDDEDKKLEALQNTPGKSTSLAEYLMTQVRTQESYPELLAVIMNSLSSVVTNSQRPKTKYIWFLKTQRVRKFEYFVTTLSLMTSDEAHTAIMRALEAAFLSRLSNTVELAASSLKGMWEMLSFWMPPMYLKFQFINQLQD